MAGDCLLFFRVWLPWNRASGTGLSRCIPACEYRVLGRFGGMRLMKPVRTWTHRIWQRVTVARVTAAGIVFTAASFATGSWQIWHQWQEERLQRALVLIEKSSAEPQLPRYRELAKTDAEETAAKWRDIDTRRALFVYFPDRFEGAPTPDRVLSRSDAEKLRDIALKRDFTAEDYRTYEKWDVARRHLNGLELFAFSYVYNFSDRTLLAASGCGALMRSNAYFKELIDAFREKYGTAQSWQIIPKAVTLMERDFGKGCATLYAAAGQ